jgi:hypothetical protein
MYPPYKCIEDGKCLATVSERDVNGDGFGEVVQELPTFRIKQRMPAVRVMLDLCTYILIHLLRMTYLTMPGLGAISNA